MYLSALSGFDYLIFIFVGLHYLLAVLGCATPFGGAKIVSLNSNGLKLCQCDANPWLVGGRLYVGILIGLVFICVLYCIDTPGRGLHLYIIFYYLSFSDCVFLIW